MSFDSGPLDRYLSAAIGDDPLGKVQGEDFVTDDVVVEDVTVETEGGDDA